MIWPGAWNRKNKYRFWDTVQQAPWQSEKLEICFWKKCKKAGLTQVEKDKIRVDAWEF